MTATNANAAALLLMLLVPWVLYLWGIIYLITQSTIFSPFRCWIARGSWLRTEFMYCPACVGFWVGFLLSFTWPFGVGWQGMLGSAVSAAAMGRLWGVLAGDETFASERKLLDLPGDRHDTTPEG